MFMNQVLPCLQYSARLSVIVLFLMMVPALVSAQSSLLNLDVEVSPSIENAQVLGFTNLGIDQTGKGPVIVSFYLENTSGARLDNLFLDIVLSSNINGTIAEIYQQNDRPFSLEAGQLVYATNNNLADERIPGIEEDLRFKANITDNGREFINSLEGSTSLPVDVYTATVTVYQNNNRLNGGTALVSSSIEIGGGTEGDIRDIFLKAPGDVLGSNVEITNPLPEFSWDGEVNLTYRLIIVRDNGLDSPEALIQAALSTNPTSGGNQAPGSLLEFENLDRVIRGINFQYPANGVQPLIPGNRYFWQLIAQIQTADGFDSRPSTVWAFTLVDNSGNAIVEITPEAQQAIINILGNDRYQSLFQSGFRLESMNVNGTELSGPQMVVRLERILESIRRKEIIVNRQ
jgi:hypothetical protein